MANQQLEDRLHYYFLNWLCPQVNLSNSAEAVFWHCETKLMIMPYIKDTPAQSSSRSSESSWELLERPGTLISGRIKGSGDVYCATSTDLGQTPPAVFYVALGNILHFFERWSLHPKKKKKSITKHTSQIHCQNVHRHRVVMRNLPDPECTVPVTSRSSMRISSHVIPTTERCFSHLAIQGRCVLTPKLEYLSI